MALTETTNIPLGFIAPDFQLPECKNQQIMGLNELKGEKGTLIIFMCNHCPFVKHIIHQLIELANDYLEKGIKLIAINSNNIISHPDDHPSKMKEWSEALNFPFPYLFDETQQVAKAYDAACTPDFALFDADLKCIYRGQLDGSRPGNTEKNDGIDVRKAFEALLNDKKIDWAVKPSIGCNIKWK